MRDEMQTLAVIIEVVVMERKNGHYDESREFAEALAPSVSGFGSSTAVTQFVPLSSDPIVLKIVALGELILEK
jgi:hypothetical protein